MYYPLRSLQEGHWFKLICGASFQHLPTVRNLVLAYALAGADCIDVAADPAVVFAAKEALSIASSIAETAPALALHPGQSPWLMVSFNDGEDPHFRKAEFDAATCPPECLRPCEAICPAQAIRFQTPLSAGSTSEDIQALPLERFSGVVSERCYGCGRCLPVCPVQHISARSYVSTPAAIAPLVLEAGIEAIEIHTQVGRVKDFQRLWAAISPWSHHLKLVSISCPDGEGLIDYLWTLYEHISPLPCALVWQTDGRPMSGDIGAGATTTAVKLGRKVLAAGLPGYIQLAGGTNDHTVPKLSSLGLLNPSRSSQPVPVASSYPVAPDDLHCQSFYISGIAYGSYARTLVAATLNQLELASMSMISSDSVTEFARSLVAEPATVLESIQGRTIMHSGQSIKLENSPETLWQAVSLAKSLVAQIKSPSPQPSTADRW